MKNSNIKRIFAGNFDLVLGLFFFLGYRLFFTWLLWHGRHVPPEPDDSYYYLANAKHILNIDSFERFRLTPFSLWVNFLSFFAKLNLETAYKINFFIGPAVMFTALYYFLSKLEKSRAIRLLLIVIMTLYSGNGDYHGFFWVVESFYQLALFFVIVGFLISDKKINSILIFFVSFLYIFMHPTSAFLSAVFVIYPLILWLFSKNEAMQAFRNLVPVAVAIIASFLAYVSIGSTFPSAGSAESLQTQVGLIKGLISGHINPVSFPLIWREYFAILFNNPLTTVTYFLMIASLYYLKKFRVLALFIAILSIVLLSSLIPYGVRTLALLWPVTFLIIAHFLVGIWKILLKINFHIKLEYLTIVPFIGVLSLATIFNTIYISSLNETKNYVWDRTCAQKIVNKSAFYTSQEALNAFLTYQNDENYDHFLSQADATDVAQDGKLLIYTKNENLKPPALTGIENFLASKITRNTKNNLVVQYPVSAWNTVAANRSLIDSNLASKNLAQKQYLDCGHFQILEVKNL